METTQVPLLDYVLANLEKARESWPAISDETGVSIHAIRKLVYRQHKNPHLSKLEALARYFREAA